MWEFISQYFVNVNVIDGGLRLDLSYAMLVIVFFVGLGQLKKKLPNFKK